MYFSGKAKIRARKVIRNKEGYYIGLKMLYNLPENIKILPVCVPNNNAQRNE
jgi:hypothetical protein